MYGLFPALGASAPTWTGLLPLIAAIPIASIGVCPAASGIKPGVGKTTALVGEVEYNDGIRRFRTVGRWPNLIDCALIPRHIGSPWRVD